MALSEIWQFGLVSYRHNYQEIEKITGIVNARSTYELTQIDNDFAQSHDAAV